MSENTDARAGGDWISLSEAQAKTHPLFGVEGWLSAVWSWLAVQIILDFFRAGAFMLFSAETALPGVIVSTVSSVIAAVTLFHLFYLRSAFPLWLGINAGFSLVIPIIASPIALIAFAVNMSILGYALVSKRVNITYRRRAKPEWLPREIEVPKVGAERQDGAG